jgi:hypothetical protein
MSGELRDLSTRTGRLLRDQGLTLSVAESCTGGLILSLLTDIAGLLLLLPATRTPFKRWLRAQFDSWMQNPNIHITRYP